MVRPPPDLCLIMELFIRLAFHIVTVTTVVPVAAIIDINSDDNNVRDDVNAIIALRYTVRIRCPAVTAVRSGRLTITYFLSRYKLLSRSTIAFISWMTCVLARIVTNEQFTAVNVPHCFVVIATESYCF